MTFAICTDNEGYEASLELRKIYPVTRPEPNDPKGYIQVVDESGKTISTMQKLLRPLICLLELNAS
jgi:hypothetical protein